MSNVKVAQVVGVFVAAPLVTGAVLAACVKYGSHYVTTLASTSVSSAGIFGIVLGVSSIFVGALFTKTNQTLREGVIVNLGTSLGLYAIFALAVKAGLSASSLTPQGAVLLIGGGSLVSVAGVYGFFALGSLSPI